MVRVKFGCAVALVLSLFVISSGYAQSKPLKKIRVGVPSVGMGNIIIFVTKEGKLFEKYGLDAEVITVMGSGIGSKALISGNLDIIPIATPTVIAANLAGADMAILAHTMPAVVHALMVRPDIKRPEDLKGKKIGVSSLGSLRIFWCARSRKRKGSIRIATSLWSRPAAAIPSGSWRSRPARSRRQPCPIPAMAWRGKWDTACCGIPPRNSTTRGWKSPRAGRQSKTIGN